MSQQLEQGKKLLEETALDFASQHGLKEETVEWVDHGFEWMLKIIDDEHTVRVSFSSDEIEIYAEDLPENGQTRKKIRDAFASLSM